MGIGSPALPQCPPAYRSESPPLPGADQHSPGKSTHVASYKQHNPFLKRQSAPPKCGSGLTPELPQELWLAAQHGQAADALWCKKSVGWPCPAPHLSPHATRDPSCGVSPGGSSAQLRPGQLGISPTAPRGLLPPWAEERLQIPLGATARTRRKLGNRVQRGLDLRNAVGKPALPPKR